MDFFLGKDKLLASKTWHCAEVRFKSSRGQSPLSWIKTGGGFPGSKSN